MKKFRCYKRCLASISQRPAWYFAIPKDCQAVCDALNAVGQSALALHGDLEQRDRDQTLVRFANGSARILVATDVAARG